MVLTTHDLIQRFFLFELYFFFALCIKLKATITAENLFHGAKYEYFEPVLHTLKVLLRC